MSSRAACLWSVLPPAVALLSHLSALPGDFAHDDELLVEQGAELRDFDLHRIFLENYWGATRADRSYRPLTLLTYALNYRVGAGAWGFHAVNLLLDAAVALVVYLVLLELLRDTALAAMGAALYAVLPVHTEAVANIVGRAELLAALAILGAWLVALRNRAPERTGPAVAASAITFLGLLAKENVIAVVPLIAAGSLILKRSIPWRTVAGTAAASAAYLLLRAAVLAGKTSVPAFLDNPFHAADPVTRAVNAVRLLGLYVWKSVVPIHLSADYSFNELPVRSLAEPLLWVEALSVVAIVGLAPWLLRRRAPLVTLAALLFAAAFAPTANLFFPIGTIFAERLAYTPSLAYPLVLCSALCAPALARSRRARIALSGILWGLVAVYGMRSWVRSADWTDRAAMYIRMPRDAPLSARSHLQAAEGWIELWRRAGSSREPRARQGSGEAADFLANAEAEAQRAMGIYSASGKAEAKIGEVLFRQERYAEAVERFTRAIPALLEHRELEPAVLRLRGESLLQLHRVAEAEKDFDRYIQVLKGLGARPDPPAFDLRGLARAFQGKLDEAMADFDRAIALHPDSPRFWNNHGMCRLRKLDPAGAIADWRRGLELCRAQNILYHPSKDSASSFLEKIAAAQRTLASSHRARGDEQSAQAAEEEAERASAEATSLKAEAERPKPEARSVPLPGK